MSGWMIPTGTNIQPDQEMYGHCDSNIDFRDCRHCRVLET